MKNDQLIDKTDNTGVM